MYMNTNTLKNNAVFGPKTPKISFILTGIILGICVLGIAMPQTTNAAYKETFCPLNLKDSADFEQNTAQKIKVLITAYSSTSDQTDDTPFITASNKYVKDGIIANNMLPFGSKVKIPELYGDKIFVVEDRMNRRKSDYHFDIWFPSKQLALNFGVKTAYIEVLEN